MEFKVRADVMALSVAGVLVAVAIAFNALSSMPKDKDQCLLQVAANAATEHGAKVAALACDRIDLKYDRDAMRWLTGNSWWSYDGAVWGNRLHARINNFSPDRRLVAVDLSLTVPSGDVGGTYRLLCEVGPYSREDCATEISEPLPVKDGKADWQWGIVGAVYRDASPPPSEPQQ